MDFTRYDLQVWLSRAGEITFKSGEAAVTWVMLNPVQTFMLAVSFLALTMMFFLMLRYLNWRRKEGSRGSQMPKKTRARWAKRHMANVMVDALEKEYGKGVLCDAEVSWGHRLVASAFKSRGFIIPELYTVPVSKQKRKPVNGDEKVQFLSHLEAVKSGIKKRLRWKYWQPLYKPVKIPGPPVPRDQAELLSQPLQKPGRFLKNHTRNA